MFTLKRWLQAEDGAIASIFGVLIAGGVMFGLMAMTVDASRIYAERQVVQNAANAAALAASDLCASGNCQNVTLASLQTKFTNPNSPDGRTDITSLCVHRSNSAACSTPSTKTLDCKNSLSASSSYVRVYTRSANTARGPLVMPVISNLFNPQARQGVALTACAQAMWGTAASADVFMPLALPPCGYEDSSNLNFKELPSTNSGLTRWGNCDVEDRDGVTHHFVNAPQGFVQVTLPGVARCTTAVKLYIGEILAINTANDQHLCGESGTAISSLLALVGKSFYVPVVAQGTSNTVTIKFFVKYRFVAFWMGNSGYPNVAPYNTSTFWNNLTPSCNQKAGKDCFYGFYDPATSAGTDTDSSAGNFGLQSVRMVP